jgi:hypothetical protein
VLDAAAMLQNWPVEAAQLLFEKRSRFVHHRELSKVELIFKNAEQNIGEPVQISGSQR